MARDIQLGADATLESVNTAHFSRDALISQLLSGLSAQLTIDAQADAWDVFMPYLTALPWLTLEGNGALTGELSLNAGKLKHGSLLTLTAPALRLSVDEQRLNPLEATPRVGYSLTHLHHSTQPSVKGA